MANNYNTQENENLQPENAEIGINADENAAGTTHLNDPITEEDITEKLNTELAEQKDKYLRLAAEFDNFRRRTAKEKIEERATAGKDIILSMLDVLDDVDRAEKQIASSEDVAQIKEGISLVFTKLRNTLLGKGVKVLESINTEFDVEKHEAISEVPGTPEQQGKVIDEIQKGYYLNDKLIRFAKVVVGK